MIETKLETVIAALQQKKLDPQTPVRIWLMVGGGALSGAYGAGVVMALAGSGYGEVFDGAIGVSTGAPTVGYFLAARADNPPGKNLHQTTVYSVEARSSGFFKSRLRLDVDWLIGVFRGSTGKRIEWDMVHKNPTRYVIVVTDWQTGVPKYIEPQTEDEMYTAIHGACSIPVMAPPVPFRENLVTDSSVGDPMPIEWLMTLPEAERPTHLLVIANTWCRPPSRHKQHLERILVGAALRHRAPPEIRVNMHKRFDRFHQLVQRALERSDVHVAVDWLPWPAKSLDRNTVRLQRLTKAGYTKWMRLLTVPHEH